MVCGRPLDATEAHWITDPPDGEHNSCRDWTQHPFPYEHELAHLRALAKYYASGYRSVVELGKWLADVRDRWPKGGGSALAHYRARKAALINKLERMRWPKS